MVRLRVGTTGCRLALGTKMGTPGPRTTIARCLVPKFSNRKLFVAN
jgi:hypothetical protein